MAITADDVGNDADRVELVKKAERLLRTATQAISDLQSVLEEITGKRRRSVKELDVNGEPTWQYAIKVAIPDSIYLTKRFLEYAAEHGFTPEQAQILMEGQGHYEGFRKYYQRVQGNANGKWQHWSLVWFKWVREQRERKTKQDAGRASRFDQQRTRA